MSSTSALIDAVKARLEAQLPTLTTAAGVPDVQQFYRHHPGKIAPERAPECWCGMAAAHRSDNPGDGGTLQKYGRIRIVMVGITASGDDPDSAQSNLETYEDLIRQTMESDQTMGGTSLGVRWIHTEYSANFGQDQPLFQECVLFFECLRRVTRGQD